MNLEKYIQNRKYYFYLIDYEFKYQKLPKQLTLKRWGFSPGVYRKERSKQNGNNEIVIELLKKFEFNDLSNENLMQYKNIISEILLILPNYEYFKFIHLYNEISNINTKQLIIKPIIILIKVIMVIIFKINGYHLEIKKDDIDYLFCCDNKYFDDEFEVYFLFIKIFINYDHEITIEIESLLLKYSNLKWLYFEILLLKIEDKIHTIIYYQELLNIYSKTLNDRYYIILNKYLKILNNLFLFNMVISLTSNIINKFYSLESVIMTEIINEYLYVLMMLKRYDDINLIECIIVNNLDSFSHFCLKVSNKNEDYEIDLETRIKYQKYIKNILNCKKVKKERFDIFFE